MLTQAEGLNNFSPMHNSMTHWVKCQKIYQRPVSATQLSFRCKLSFQPAFYF